IILGVNVNILSSYHPSQVTVIAGDRKGKLTAKGNTIYVNSKSIERYGCSADSFTLKWQDKTRSYAGSLEVWAEKGELILVNKVEEDAYLASVVGAEMVPGAELEALKAQAVLCRTFIYTAMNHCQDDWDLCDLTHCQSYRGLETVTDATRKAAAETDGMLLTYHGEPCKVYYHSTSGGQTADAASIWPTEDEPYLKSVPDPYCSDSPHYRWEFVATPADIARALNFPSIADLRVIYTFPDGRVDKVGVKYLEEGLLYDGWNFRMLLCQALGWNTVKSSWFEIERDCAAYVFRGRGLGHGVGLSQWGAAGMAYQGADFRKILAHYYPGTEVKRW
ncbi:MAG: SpoIID/LytB domain-containing protein, partial [candidate division WOR-3 bacterium]|nr:SpoIID/LytB domain-containing protein [candidate division WOR-3 bacterium]